MAQQLANLGYLALKVEATKGTAVTPNVYAPLYSESLNTSWNFDEDNPIVGLNFMRYQLVKGMRSHTGDVQVLAEPNTAARFLDMIMNRGSVSGSDPYTHPFTFGTSEPKSYTVDIAKGEIVFRYMGVEVGSLGNEFSDNKMLFNLGVSALKSFTVREISNVASNVLTFNTDYDPAPTDGLVAGDLIRLFKADGSYVDTTVTSVDSTVVITVGSATGVASGDHISLRKATPSLVIADPFTWSRTEYRFGSDAATALSATQTRVDESVYNLLYEFEDSEGAKRSGAYDPAALIRLQPDVELNIRRLFETGQASELHEFLAKDKTALVIRHFSGTEHELRLTFNNLKKNTFGPELESNAPIYVDNEYKPVYDTSDGQAFDVKVINAVSSLS